MTLVLEITLNLRVNLTTNLLGFNDLIKKLFPQEFNCLDLRWCTATSLMQVIYHKIFQSEEIHR